MLEALTYTAMLAAYFGWREAQLRREGKHTLRGWCGAASSARKDSLALRLCHACMPDKDPDGGARNRSWAARRVAHVLLSMSEDGVHPCMQVLEGLLGVGPLPGDRAARPRRALPGVVDV